MRYIGTHVRAVRRSGYLCLVPLPVSASHSIPSPEGRECRRFRCCLLAALNAAPMALFSAAPTGCRTVYAARLTCFTGRGVTAFLTVRAGCVAFRSGLGVALRTDLRTTRRANPIATSWLPFVHL